jgi:AcrR family transcriptional regulator
MAADAHTDKRESRAPRRPSRRAELVSIAASLFAERGFANVTVDELGAAAGVSGPALYHHFDGKEALLGEMLVGISRSLLDRGLAIVDAARGETALDELIDMHVDFALDDRALITVHFRELVHAPTPTARRSATCRTPTSISGSQRFVPNIPRSRTRSPGRGCRWRSV